jgi:hypothetical protein
MAVYGRANRDVGEHVLGFGSSSVIQEVLEARDNGEDPHMHCKVRCPNESSEKLEQGPDIADADGMVEMASGNGIKPPVGLYEGKQRQAAVLEGVTPKNVFVGTESYAQLGDELSHYLVKNLLGEVREAHDELAWQTENWDCRMLGHCWHFVSSRTLGAEGLVGADDCPQSTCAGQRQAGHYNSHHVINTLSFAVIAHRSSQSFLL